MDAVMEALLARKVIICFEDMKGWAASTTQSIY